MKLLKCVFVLSLTILLCSQSLFAQSRGVKSIEASSMKPPMKFLSATEFQGRNMPSVELEIASKYIALMAEQIGLKPLMPDGSFFQEMPLEITGVAEGASHVSMIAGGQRKTFHYPESFGIKGRYLAPGTASGEVVFLGLGVSAPELGWDDYAGLDLKGKIAVLFDLRLPENHPLNPTENRTLLTRRAGQLREKGVAAIISIISPERETLLSSHGISFDNIERGRPVDTTAPISSMQSSALYQVEVRHEVAAALLGISPADIAVMMDNTVKGKRVSPMLLIGTMAELAISFNTRRGSARNVVAYLEGSHPKLRREYVVLGSHHDGIGYRESVVFHGADDNNSGVIAMFELGKALMIERPKRSVIFVWHTGEEKGLLGAYHFVSHCPVPVENISANLNMDMLCRNHPDSLYLIGSNKLSSSLDRSINEMNKKYIKLKLDYKYESPAHPDRFFFRSDQYPYIRYGIPGVWFFCGTTEDYHQEKDIEERVDYKKLEKVTKLVYYTLMDIGNKPQMLKLDLHPEVTTRGAHNIKVSWQPPAQQRSR
ncbi:MAG: M28 family peptidase [bacterium]